MKFSQTLLIGASLGVAYCTSAGALTIAPTQPPSAVAVTCSGGTHTGNDTAWFPANCAAMVGLTEFYKNDAPSTESGTLAGSYVSSLNGDLSGGSITWTGPTAVLCSAGNSCWLLLKDGNHSPYRYAFNLTNIWNGTDTITLSGFWPNGGEISHWGLWGQKADVPDEPPQVPEPGTLALLGLGLLGLGISRRLKRE